MKQLRTLLVALLALVLACTCLSAVAEAPQCDHLIDGKTAYAWKTVQEATCTEKGRQEYTCTKCGHVAQKQEVAASGHKAGAWEIETPASCTQKGSEVKKCTVCGAVVERREIAATGHNTIGAPWVRVKEPTCKEAGREAQLCLTCGKEANTREIPKLTADSDHNWVEIDKEIKATCETDGKFAQYQCTVCGAIKGGKTVKATGHKEGKPVTVAEPTCIKDGKAEIFCTVCGKKLNDKKLPATGHKPGKNWEVEKEATCTADGSKVIKCTVCGKATKREAIKAHGHDTVGSPWVRVLEPTCAKPGREAQLCNICGKEVNTRKIDKLTADATHEWVMIDEAVEVTCTTDGKTAQEQCTVCGAIKGGKVIKAKGHKNSTEILTAATCTADGSKRITCSVCGKSETVKIPAPGHKGEWKVLEKPTEKKDGLSVKLCKVCGFELDRNNVPFTKMLYNNTICAFGPETRSLVGGKDWYRVTPIDLSQEGIHTYDLIASNAYVVGSATVTVANGTLTVSYQLNSKQIHVRSEDLIIYPNVEALRHPTPATAGVYAFNQPIDISASFGQDTKVLVSVFLKADYDQIGAGVSVFRPDQAKLDALSALID